MEHIRNFSFNNTLFGPIFTLSDEELKYIIKDNDEIKNIINICAFIKTKSNEKYANWLFNTLDKFYSQIRNEGLNFELSFSSILLIMDRFLNGEMRDISPILNTCWILIYCFKNDLGINQNNVSELEINPNSDVLNQRMDYILKKTYVNWYEIENYRIKKTFYNINDIPTVNYSHLVTYFLDNINIPVTKQRLNYQPKEEEQKVTSDNFWGHDAIKSKNNSTEEQIATHMKNYNKYYAPYPKEGLIPDFGREHYFSIYKKAEDIYNPKLRTDEKVKIKYVDFPSYLSNDKPVPDFVNKEDTSWTKANEILDSIGSVLTNPRYNDLKKKFPILENIDVESLSKYFNQGKVTNVIKFNEEIYTEYLKNRRDPAFIMKMADFLRSDAGNFIGEKVQEDSELKKEYELFKAGFIPKYDEDGEEYWMSKEEMNREKIEQMEKKTNYDIKAQQKKADDEINRLVNNLSSDKQNEVIKRYGNLDPLKNAFKIMSAKKKITDILRKVKDKNKANYVIRYLFDVLYKHELSKAPGQEIKKEKDYKTIRDESKKTSKQIQLEKQIAYELANKTNDPKEKDKLLSLTNQLLKKQLETKMLEDKDNREKDWDDIKSRFDEIRERERERKTKYTCDKKSNVCKMEPLKVEDIKFREDLYLDEQDYYDLQYAYDIQRKYDEIKKTKIDYIDKFDEIPDDIMDQIDEDEKEDVEDIVDEVEDKPDVRKRVNDVDDFYAEEERQKQKAALAEKKRQERIKNEMAKKKTGSQQKKKVPPKVVVPIPPIVPPKKGKGQQKKKPPAVVPPFKDPNTLTEDERTITKDTTKETATKEKTESLIPGTDITDQNIENLLTSASESYFSTFTNYLGITTPTNVKPTKPTSITGGTTDVYLTSEGVDQEENVPTGKIEYAKDEIDDEKAKKIAEGDYSAAFDDDDDDDMMVELLDPTGKTIKLSSSEKSALNDAAIYLNNLGYDWAEYPIVGNIIAETAGFASQAFFALDTAFKTFTLETYDMIDTRIDIRAQAYVRNEMKKKALSAYNAQEKLKNTTKLTLTQRIKSIAFSAATENAMVTRATAIANYKADVFIKGTFLAAQSFLRKLTQQYLKLPFIVRAIFETILKIIQVVFFTDTMNEVVDFVYEIYYFITYSDPLEIKRSALNVINLIVGEIWEAVKNRRSISFKEFLKSQYRSAKNALKKANHQTRIIMAKYFSNTDPTSILQSSLKSRIVKTAADPKRLGKTFDGIKNTILSLAGRSKTAEEFEKNFDEYYEDDDELVAKMEQEYPEESMEYNEKGKPILKIESARLPEYEGLDLILDDSEKKE